MKKYIPVLIVLWIAFAISGNAQTWQWAQRGGGTDYDQGISIATDRLGNCYVSGNYLSASATFGSVTLPQNGFNDIFIAKYDGNGNLLWAKHAGGNNAMTAGEGGDGIAVDTLGNCYITGVIAGSVVFDTITLNASSQGNIFVAKYNTNGNCSWAKKAGGNGGDYGDGISIDVYGNLYVTGLFRGTAAFGTFSLTSPNASGDVFIAKYNNIGNCLWVRQGNTSGGGSSVCANMSRNCVVTGSFLGSASFGTFNLNSSGNGDVFIARYDSSGNCLWAKSGGSPNNDYSNGISTDYFGNCYVTGNFTGIITANFSPYSLTGDGIANIFIVKYDSSGICKWAKQASGTGSELGYGIATSSIGNSYLVGNFGGVVAFGSCSISGGGTFISKLDSSGSCIWIKPTNASSVGGTNAISLDTNGNAYITGSFQNTATFDSYNLSSAGQNDVFVAKLDDLTSIPPSSNRIMFNIYPNPSGGSFTVVVPTNLLNLPNVQITVYDILGNLVLQQPVNSSLPNYILNLSGKSPGVYNVKLSNGHTAYSANVILQ